MPNPKRILLAVSTVSDLKGGQNDIDTIFQVFTDAAIGDCDEEQSRKKIFEKDSEFYGCLTDFLKEWNKRDQLIFYFSGHGTSERGYYSFEFGIKPNKSCYPFDNFLTILDQKGVQRAIIIVDACYSGEITKGNPLEIVPKNLPKGYLFLASSSAVQVSKEIDVTPQKTMGAFTHLLSQSLTSGLDDTRTKDGFIYVDDVQIYITNALTEDTYKDCSQTPYYGADNVDSPIYIAKNVSGTIIEKTESSLPKELSVVHKRNPNDIVGRDTDLQELHDLLFDEKQVVLVNGLGGIGKTTLAETYIAKYYDDYHHFVWITQNSDNIGDAFVQNRDLWTHLNIDVDGLQAQAIFEAILRALRSIEDRPSLLVIDNALPSIEQHLSRLPNQPNWHLLVTSRQTIEGLHTKALGFLKPEDALALFQKHCTLIKDEASIKKLLKTVDYNTLVIEILAKTAQKQRTPIEILQKAIEHDLKANIKTKHSQQQKIEKITTYLSSIFEISELSEMEIWVLKQFACLPSESHTFDLLQQLIFKGNSDNKENFPETLSDLHAKGWLLYDTKEDSYKMHRIIAQIIPLKVNLELTDIEGLLDNVTSNLYIDRAKDNPIDKFIWIDFGEAILTHFLEDTSTQIAKLQNNLATVLRALGDYQGAKVLLEKAVKSAEINFGDAHPTTAVSYSNLATVLQDLGDYQGAKVLLEKAVKSDEINFGDAHPNTAVRYSNLALVLKDLGDYQGAKVLLEKAVKSDEINFGDAHPNTAVGYSNLALVLKALGDYQRAKGLLEKAVKSDELNFGDAHPSTARSYSNLALLLCDLGELEEALVLAKKALGIFQVVLPVGHPTIDVVAGNVAFIQRAMEDRKNGS